MKPLKLELDHIGPFANHTVINFGELGDIFLIHGKTGSGKTTLFDAICYALYGKLPGPRRDQLARLKSDFSPPEAIPRVVLEFSLGPRIWRIERSPSSLRPKKKGQGMRMSEDEVVLFERMPNGSLEQIEGMKSKTDETVARLIGLSAEEFSRIILLPQGEFAEFLRQNSKERREVLKKLFPIARAERVKELAQERGRQLKGALAEAERRLRDLEGSAESAGDESPEKVLERERATLASSEEKRSRLKDSLDGIERYRRSLEERQEALAEARERLAQAEHALAEALAQQESIDRKKDELARARAAEPFTHFAERREETQGARERAREEKKEAEKALEKAQRRMAESRKEKDALDDLRKEIAQLAQHKKALEELGREEEESAKALAERDRLKNETEATHRDLAELARREEALLDEERTLLPIAGKLEELGRIISEKRARLDTLNPLVDWAREHARIQKELDRTAALGKDLARRKEALLPALEESQSTLQTLKEGLDAKQSARLAARLAASLEKGAPCPVCGAIEHPLPAAAPGGSVDEDEEALHEADKVLRHNQNELARLEAELQLARDEYKRYQNERERQGPAPAGADDRALAEARKGADGSIRLRTMLEQEREAITTELNELTGPHKEAGKAGSRINELRLLRDRLTAERQGLDRAETIRAPRLAVLETALATLSAKRKKILDSPLCAGAETGDEARGRIGKAEEALSQRIIAIEKNMEAAIESLAAAQKRGENADKLCMENEESCLRAESAFNEALNQSPFANEGELEQALATLATRDAFEEVIRQHEKKLEAGRTLRDERQRGEASALAALEGILKALPPLLKEGIPPAPPEFSSDRPEPAQETIVAILKHCDKEREQLGESLVELQAERDRIRDRIANLERQGREHAEARERWSRLSREAAEYDRLYRDLGGTNASKKAFDAWLMGMYLREVTAFASKRLEKMSEGRYRLMVDSDNGRRTGLTGLDLAVWDACTGKTRPCATLSGGESFMASISLALGLADSIQNRSGGIRLDALFIDEGFGSLDEQSLEQALNILDEIRDHRMVGLISHVGEMRTRIPSRIEVIKTPEGSSVRPAIDRD